jgi:hypothetical protein
VGSRYFVQGDLSFLDAAGEFYVGGGYVYYLPRKTPIEAQEILAPQVKAIVQICPRFQPGEVPLPTQGPNCGHTATVHDIAFVGLTFEATEFTTEYPDRTAGGPDPAAMIYMESTRAVTVRSCHLKNAGQHAIAMVYGNDGNSVYGNWIENSGLSAVYVRSLFSYTGQKSGNHRIRNNKIELVGMHAAGPFGIYLEYSHANVVSHNRMAHAPRGLMGGAGDLPAPAAGNYFGYSDLSSGTEDSADIATFYFAGICANDPCSVTDLDLSHMPLKTAEQLRVDGAAWDAASGLAYPRSLPPWGFYLDNGSSNWQIDDVSVTDVAASPVNDSVRLYHGGTGFSEDNVSWSAGFRPGRIDDDNIGLRPDFPPAFYNGGLTWKNDTSSACSYSGTGWIYRADAPVADAYGADEHSTNVAGDSVTCAFDGSEVVWVTSSSGNRGVVDVLLDGVLDRTVDTATPADFYQHVVYRKTGLTPGPHTIRIVLRGDRPAIIDYFVVDALGSL